MAENTYCDSGSSLSLAPEPFVSADEGARFLSISRRYLLALARRGLAGAYALGTGMQRKTWVFRLSELADAVATQNSLTTRNPKCVTIPAGNLHAGKRTA
jgi:hypothetical protein